MLKAVTIALAAGLLGLIIGLPYYLGPDDIRSCGNRPDPAREQCRTADAIVAISGGDTAARTAEAVSLYQAGWAPKLIFSGAASDSSSPSNAAAMRQQAINAGIDPDSITVEEFARDTEENAQRIREITVDKTPERLILVTSAYHQRRASIEFGNSFSGDTEIVNHPVSADNQWNASWWLTPGGWWLAGGETLKIMTLHARGIW